MDWFNVGLTLDVVGKILLGVTVLMVHSNVIKEHRIDRDVLHTMKREQVLGILAILMIIAGYVLQFVYHI